MTECFGSGEAGLRTRGQEKAFAPCAEPGERYYVFHEGTQYGPSALEELSAWYAQGSLDATTMAWDGVSSLWVPLLAFPPFRDLAEAHAPGAAPRDAGTALRASGAESEAVPPGARVVAGTAVYPSGFRAGRERRTALRLPASLRLDFHVVHPSTRQPASLLYSYALENISVGGFGLSIYGTDIQAGSWIRAWIELEPENTIFALGEVVRVYGRRSIGVGFRDISDRMRLDEFLTRRRP